MVSGSVDPIPTLLFSSMVRTPSETTLPFCLVFPMRDFVRYVISFIYQTAEVLRLPELSTVNLYLVPLGDVKINPFDGAVTSISISNSGEESPTVLYETNSITSLTTAPVVNTTV